MVERRGDAERSGLVRRRTLLKGGGAAAACGVVGVVGWQAAPPALTTRVRRELGLLPDAYIPDAAEGEIRVERMDSAAMGSLDLFTAVPAGHGDGSGLPVIVVLHGASASAADLRGFGLGRFVTAAVAAGAPPFVLVGTDDGPDGWLPSGDVDPQRMLVDELPRWLTARGYDADRRALWGWSRGGYGALELVVDHPGWASALALFSPALRPGDRVLGDLDVLRDLPWGLWCGVGDPFYEGALALAAAAPVAPDPWVTGEGGHTRIYWNSHTVEMLHRLADLL
jgi:pimeloyl-ACP methyl ester carboxylesterase